MKLLQCDIDNLETIDSVRIDRLRKLMQDREASLCSERALIYTDVFKQTEGEPFIIRKAKGFAQTLRQMSLYVLDDALFFGNQASRNFAAPIFPEYSIDWLVNEMDTFEQRKGDVFQVSDKVKADLREIQPYWSGNTHEDVVLANIPSINREAEKQRVLHRGGISNSGDGHIVSDHEWILDIGYRGMIELIDEKLDNPALTQKQIDFYQAAKLTLEAALDYVKRYHPILLAMADKTKNPKRKAELEAMAQMSLTVLEGPATSFYEGVQAIFINHILQMIESNGHSFCYGRFDQFMYPLYKQDIEKGNLTEAKALEFVTQFFILNNSLNKIRSNGHTKFSMGYPLYTNLMVGGLTPEGIDGTNMLSYLSIEAMNICRLNEPNFSMRYSKETPDDLLLLAAKLIKTGMGMPSMFNDHVAAKGLMDLGIPKEDALDYVAIGCVETGVQGKYGHRATGMTYVNWGKVLEIILHNGKDPASGVQLFKLREDNAFPQSYDELWQDWQTALKFYSDLAVASDKVCDASLEKYDASPFGSIFIHNSLELGTTLKEGGAKYDVISQSNIGSSIVGNSLMAIKELVYDTEQVTFEEMMEALGNNWQDEELHDLFMEVAKFGNDIDEVDEIVKDIFNSYLELLPGYDTIRKGRGPEVSAYTMSTSNITSYIPNGLAVGATPDGRYAGDPLNEGCSPTQSTDTEGPTALINSVSKLPNDQVAAGQLLNTRFSPTTLEGEENLDKFVSFLKASVFKGIYHNQFNVMNTETLRKAQEKPQDYRDLIVRVAGYCAQFVSLMPEAQEAIIARSEHAL